ncbi:tRNA-specific adenosine deaminase [Hydrogenophaga soli]|nr:tRNA adenosine(34) deaminase TadA [Burkholderiaceae bacterium]
MTGLSAQGYIADMNLCNSTPMDEHWMSLALAQAQKAAQKGEVPVGAVVVKDGVLLATGHNQPVGSHDPTAHAEMVALRAAAQALGNYRLEGCTLYVTLEPCVMCSGALLHARLSRVVYGAREPKTGGAGSVLDVFAQPQLNHHTQVQGGVLAPACAAELQAFFKPRRINPEPLRDDALRTPLSRLAGGAELPCASHHVSDLPSLQGLRLHYLDERPVVPAATPSAPPSDTPAVTWLALHPPQDWCHRFAPLIAPLVAQGHRVLAPDLIGFGLSDKPKKSHIHQRDWHLQVLTEWLERVEAHHLALLLDDDGHGLGAALHRLVPERFAPAHQVPERPLVPPDTPTAQAAPYPDNGHRVGPLALLRWPR